mmetsp:Transcript_18042/g.30722  ORF Transcript_18042/g.30722 Transcript_18042/m.30722 type:complete len:1399 (-) Transcript_18042:30-4226(-)
MEATDIVEEKGMDRSVVLEESDQQDQEQRFRQRYSHLKNIYEERLGRISKRVKDVQLVLENDPVLQKMRADPTTMAFVPSRSQEIAAEAMSEEREQQIVHLAEQLSEATVNISEWEHRYRGVLKQVKQERKQNQARLGSIVNENTALKESLREARSRVQDLEHRWGLHQAEKLKEREQWRVVLRRLQASLPTDTEQDVQAPVWANEDNSEQANTSWVFERLSHLEHQLRSKNVAYTRMKQSAETLQGQLDAQIEQTSKAKGAIQAESLKIAHAKEEEKRAKEALARSEQERLEIRGQYMAIGEKLEHLVSHYDEQSRKDTEKLREKLHEAEERGSQHANMCDRLQRELNAITIQMERKDNKYQDLQVKLENVQSESATKIANIEAVRKQEMQTQQNKYDLLLERYEDTKKELTAKLEQARTEAKEYLATAQAGREQFEKEKSQQVTDFQSKLEDQFQKLLNAKQTELDNALSQKQSEVDRRQEEDSRVEMAVSARLQGFLKDHISMAQHREIVAAQVANAQAQMDRSTGEIQKQISSETRLAAQEAEEKAKLTYAAQAERIKNENSSLRMQLEQAKRERSEMELALEEDRRRIAVYRRQIDEGSRKQSSLAQNLGQALGNISRLKKIVTEQREQQIARSSVEATTHELSENELKMMNNAIHKLRDELQQTERELDAQRAALKQSENDRMTEQSNFRKQLHIVETQAAEQLLQREAELTRLKETNKLATNELESRKDNELKQAEARIRHEMELLKLQSEAILKENTKRIKDLETKLEHADSTAAQYQNLLVDTRDKLGLEEKESSRLNNRVRELESEAKQMQRSLDDRDRTITTLEVANKCKMQTTSEITKATIGKVADSVHSIGLTFRALSTTVRKQLATTDQEFHSMGEQLLEYVEGRVGRMSRRHSENLVIQAKELDTIYSQRVEAIRMELEYTQSRRTEQDEIAKTLFVSKGEEGERIQNVMSETLSQLNDLRKSMQVSENTLSEKEEHIAHLNAELEEVLQTNKELRKELEKNAGEIQKLDSQLEKRISNFKSVLVTVRSRLPFPQELVERLVNGITAETELHEFHTELDIALKQHDVNVATLETNTLNEQLRDAQAKISSNKRDRETTSKSMQAVMEQLEARNKQLTELQEKLRLSQVELDDARSTESTKIVRIKDDHRIDIENSRKLVEDLEEKHKKSNLEANERFRDSLRAMKEAHAQDIESMRREALLNESQLKEKVENERLKNERLREEIIKAKSQERVWPSGNLGGGESTGLNSQSGSTRYIPTPNRDRSFMRSSASNVSRSSISNFGTESRVGDLDEFQSLLKRSATLDSHAQDLFRESVNIHSATLPSRVPISSASLSRPSTQTRGTARPNTPVHVDMSTSASGGIRTIRISSPASTVALRRDDLE